MKPRRFKLETLRAVAPFRLPGYLDHVLSVGALHGDEIELTAAQHESIRQQFRSASPSWPAWAVLASLFQAETDQGIGDTIARELGGGKSEAFKRHHEAVFGVWQKPCSCAGQVASWNALYPYPEQPLGSDV